MPEENSVPNKPIKPPSNYSGLLTVLFLLLTSITLLLWRGYTINSELTLEHDRLMAHITRGVGEAILTKMKNLERRVSILIQDQNTQIQNLAADPENDTFYDDLESLVKRDFPNAFAFTITDANGEPLLTDFEGFVGDICQRDIKRSIKNPGTVELEIHPHIQMHHFDITVPLPAESAIEGIFFLSFDAALLSEILSSRTLAGYELFLENRKTPGLIEVSTEGPRSKLQRDYKLSDEEQQRIVNRRPISGTQWNVVSLRSAKTGIAGLQLWQQTLWAVLALLIVGVSALLILFQTHRTMIEQCLIWKKNDEA